LRGAIESAYSITGVSSLLHDRQHASGAISPGHFESVRDHDSTRIRQIAGVPVNLG
jgi:hypothetical protein